jgi:hypothetical protein
MIGQFINASICILFSIFSCNSSIPLTQTQTDQEMLIPTITNEFEKFDTYKFDSSLKVNIETKQDGTYIERERQSYGYITRIYNPQSYFIIIKQFYDNGFIKEKGVVFNSGYFTIGPWYSFNKQGILEKTVNNDNGYTYSFQDLFKYLNSQKIGLSIGRIELYSGIHTTIEKESIIPGSPVWKIRWQKEPQLIEEIIMDGKNGNVISKHNVLIKEG